MSAGHSHAIPATGNDRSLWVALGLTSTFLVAEVIAGIVYQSLAFLADSAQMFTDAAALAIAVAAVRIARRPAGAKRDYGYHRFEILAAAFNGVLLFGVAIYILYEAHRRFNAPAEVQPLGMLVVAALGLAVNLLSMRLLQAGKDTSLNLKGACLKVWADMLGSVGVIVAALMIRFTGWARVNTLVEVGIGLWVLPRTWVLLKKSLNILLEGAPEGVDVDEVGRTMLAVPGGTGVHDLHVWVLTSGKNAIIAHIVRAAGIGSAALIEPLKQMLADRFKVFHTTLQIEPTACQHSEDGCNFVEQRRSAKPPESNAGHVQLTRVLGVERLAAGQFVLPGLSRRQPPTSSSIRTRRPSADSLRISPITSSRVLPGPAILTGAGTPRRTNQRDPSLRAALTSAITSARVFVLFRRSGWYVTPASLLAGCHTEFASEKPGSVIAAVMKDSTVAIRSSMSSVPGLGGGPWCLAWVCPLASIRL